MRGSQDRPRLKIRDGFRLKGFSPESSVVICVRDRSTGLIHPRSADGGRGGGNRRLEGRRWRCGEMESGRFRRRPRSIRRSRSRRRHIRPARSWGFAGSRILFYPLRTRCSTRQAHPRSRPLTRPDGRPRSGLILVLFLLFLPSTTMLQVLAL